MTVVFGTDKIPAGAMVFVPGDLCAGPDAKRVYEIDGKKCIFLSLREVKVVRTCTT